MTEPLTKEERATYLRARARELKYLSENEDFERFARFALVIKTKRGRIEPFILNDAQKILHTEVMRQLEATGRVRVIILKGRQTGISTYIQGLLFWLTSQTQAARAFVLSHEASSTAAIFEMAKRFYDHCAPEFKPKLEKSNVRELLFGDSGYKVGTASGTGQIGRGSTFTAFHGSEVAFYPTNNIVNLTSGCLQCVSNEPGTFVFLESTANGMSNYFCKLWNQAQRGESDFEPVFISWTMMKEYRRDKSLKLIGPSDLSQEEKDIREAHDLTVSQIMWRRAKIKELGVEGRSGERSFAQEYPLTPAQAFLTSNDNSLISPERIALARMNQKIPDKIIPSGNLIMSCDPARYGNDATAVGRRKGRFIYDISMSYNLDTMEVAAMLHNLIQKEHPQALFLDIGGLGIGIFDRLRELGHFDVLRPVNGSAKALDYNKYHNKRAECYGVLNDWLSDKSAPLGLPDDDILETELGSIGYRMDSKGRIVLDSKRDMKKSPDRADSVAYLFAEPVFENADGVWMPDITGL